MEYGFSARTTSLAGLYLVWIRGGTGADTTQHLGISLDAVLIILCSALALRYAIAGDIATHRRWAMRLFLVANGVWFFRISLMFWILVNHGPVGFNMDTFTGPALSFLSFADSLLPLLILECYLRSSKARQPWRKFATATLLGIFSLAMCAGIFAATMFLWLPHM